MPDFGAPIAQNVDVSPNKGLQTLSDLMGLQQRQIAISQAQQNLETGKAVQQSAQAGAAQDVQKNNELQALAQFTHNASKDPAYLNADGSPNVGKYQRDAMTVAPVYGQAYIGQMTSNFNGGVENRKALLDLGSEQAQKAASFFSPVATNPNATTDDFLNASEQARGLSDDRNYQRTIDRMLMHAPPTGTLPSATSSQVVQRYAQGVISAFGGTLPVAPGQVESSTNIQPGAVNRFTGAFTPSGQPIPKEPIITTPAGPLAVAKSGPRGPTLTPLTTNGQAAGLAPNTGPVPNLNTTRAQQENVQGMAGDDKTRYAQISQEGTNAATGAQLADQVARLAEQVRTGTLTKEWADRLTTLQQHDPSITARQMLTKYAAQLKTMATTGASTDASRSQIDEGMPSPETMDPDAVKQAAQYVGGIFRQRSARQAYADQFVEKNGGSSLGIRGPDDAFMRSDPTVFAYEALPPGQARQDFLRAHGLTTPERQAAFQAQRNQIKHYGGQ